MASSWTAATALDNLKIQLDARAGLDGVAVHTADPGDDESTEMVVFYEVEGEESPASMGQEFEEYVIKGFALIVKPGAGETKVKAARDRVVAIIKEVADQVDTDRYLNGAVGDARIGALHLKQGYTQEGRWAAVEFGIAVKNIIT